MLCPWHVPSISLVCELYHVRLLGPVSGGWLEGSKENSGVLSDPEGEKEAASCPGSWVGRWNRTGPQQEAISPILPAQAFLPKWNPSHLLQRKPVGGGRNVASSALHLLRGSRMSIFLPLIHSDWEPPGQSLCLVLSSCPRISVLLIIEQLLGTCVGIWEGTKLNVRENVIPFAP